MASPAVLMGHECNAFPRQEILEAFPNTDLGGFYFHFLVREKTTFYYLCTNIQCTGVVHMHQYHEFNDVHNLFWDTVVKVEDITRCEARAVQVITQMLGNLNVCETAYPDIIREIRYKADLMSRGMGPFIPGVKIPITVSITKVFRIRLDRDQAQDQDQDGDEDEDEDENHGAAADQAATLSLNEHQHLPVPASRSSMEALEKVKLKPKGSCTICLGGLIKATRLPCDHTFHERCIVKWLRRNNVCPLCRFRLSPAN